MLVGGTVRFVYGVGSIVAPAWMVKKEFAPDTLEQAEPRLLLRAFGGHQFVASALAFAALRRGSARQVRDAATLGMLIDMFDVGSAAIEIVARRRADVATVGGIAFSGLGVLTFAAVRRLAGGATMPAAREPTAD